ncbi:MAG TPA: acyl-CoA dehydrogenase family protein [Streptosporangiaceae bacterium]|jgi:3-hydroxy-9,10-secoandrosta-1,3,5(10)-triene-9,17-dione monooxygenase
MTALSSVGEPAFPAPPEQDLTPARVILRAEEIASSLIDLQAETERRHQYAPDTHEQFTRAGFYRILVPRRFGGYEFGAETFIQVGMALARGCPSTAWMYVFGAAHALPVATLFGERAQDELFRAGDFVCPAVIGPAGTAERADGGWVLSGTWRYCSGAPYATHFLGHTLVSQGGGPPAPMLFIMPRGQWRIEDDWGDQLGLRGSGSQSITVTGEFVPDHFTLGTHMSLAAVTDETPGHLLHDNPEYGGGQLSFMQLELGALAVGMAKGALDAYAELMRNRITVFLPFVPRVADPDYQFCYGEALGMISAAEAALMNAVQQWHDACAAGPASFTKKRELQLAMISREAVRLCWRAVEGQLFPTAGSSSARHGQRIERVWRDMSMLHSHAGLAVFLGSLANRELAKAEFGVE